METMLVDNEWLAVKLPEGFSPIAHDELEGLMGVEYDRMWGVRDEGRHMLISITWKDSNKLLTKLMNEARVAGQVNETFAKRYRKHAFHYDGGFERTVAGASAQACGFRFSYEVEGVAQQGEVLVFKRGIRCYTMYCYMRVALAQECQPVYEGILDSLELR